MSIPEYLAESLQLQSPVTCEPIAGGAVNHIYSLTDREHHYIVKWLGNDSFSGIDRAAQFAMQKQLAAHSIAPAPVWLSEDHKWWVEQFVTGDSPNISAIQLAGALSQIHQLPVSAPSLDLVQRLVHYQAAGKIADTDELAIATRRVITALSARENTHSGLEDDTVFCHNDLSAGHIMRLSPLLIIDWEYGARANRYFDLAACASINQLGASQCASLVCAYAEHTHIPVERVAAEFAFYQEVVTVTEGLWTAAAKNSVKSTQAEQ